MPLRPAWPGTEIARAPPFTTRARSSRSRVPRGKRSSRPTSSGAQGSRRSGAPRRVDSRPPSAADGGGVAAAGARETRHSALIGSFDSLCRRTPGGRGSQKWLRGPLPGGRGTASGTSSVAIAARRAAARRCWRWWFEVGIVQSKVDGSRATGATFVRRVGNISLCFFFDFFRPTHD